MISTRALLLLFGFLVAIVAPRAWAEGGGAVMDEEDDEYADPEVVEPALLVAHKTVKTAKIVQGCNVTIAVSLFNVGTGCDFGPAAWNSCFGRTPDVARSL